MREERFAVIYRANENLSALVARLNTVFVKEFDPQMSVEDIAKELLLLPHDVWQRKPDENRQNGNQVSVLIDGTVWAAMKFAEGNGATVPWNSEFNHDESRREMYFIRQDDVNGYDLYADHIATVARNASRVIIVRTCIADHNSEGLDDKSQESLVAREPWRVEQVLNKWIERLKARNITPMVIERLSGYDTTGEYALAEEIPTNELKNAVVICDGHHLNKCPRKWWTDYGVHEIFRANPPFHYADFPLRDFLRRVK